MSAENPDLKRQMERLGPYIHPEHWDGHTFGQGELGKITMPRYTLPSIKKFCREALEGYLNAPGGRLALETYQKGDVFNLDNYASGTIIAYRSEFLMNAYVRDDIDLTGVKPAPINDRLPEGKDFSHSRLAIKADLARHDRDTRSIEYSSGALWGIVTRRSQRSKGVLLSVGPSSVEGSAPDVTVKSAARARAEPIPVGTPIHTSFVGCESLQRVNILEVCAYGSKESERRPVFDVLQRFTTAHGMAQ